MSEIHAELKNTTTVEPIFTEMARWLVALVLIMGPLLHNPARQVITRERISITCMEGS